MLQVLQDVSSGALELKDIPTPALASGTVKVRTIASLISAGTEKMIIDLAQKSMLGKAQARPDLVKQVLDKVRKEGLINTYNNVRSKMERPLPLGYSAAGVVTAVGEGVVGLKVGDCVAMAGAGYANHAEVNVVPKNLVALMPDGVTFEDASYTTVASIALQGVRQAKPELGDNVVVVGLGLIGLITVQLLKANGCRVFGVDLDEQKVKLGMELGMDAGSTASEGDPASAISRFTGGYGADSTLITAATKSNQPIEFAGDVTRRKGQVVVVGAVGMDVPRDLYYKKEIDIKISMSYGPGRYDPTYEEGGIDYPYDYVRWTEQRNMQAVLNLIGEGKLDVARLTTHRYAFDKAIDAYSLIQGGSEPYAGVVLTYDAGKQHDAVVRLTPKHRPVAGTIGVGFVGAGNYAALHLIPHLQSNNAVVLQGLVTATGLNANQKAEKFGFAYCTTDMHAVLTDDSVNAVFIGTRHSTHAQFTIDALSAGKHVFVEKPLVVTEDQLTRVSEAYARANEETAAALMVGLNRRFAPMVDKLRDAFPAGGVKQMVYRVNSGHIPTSSWLHQPEEGAGMMIGEMCHFIDLMQYISGEDPVQVYAQALRVGNQSISDNDNLIITVSFENGSVGTLCYNTVGDKAFPKERIEIYGDGTVAALDDFRSLEVVSNGKRTRTKASNQDKGQKTQLAQTVKAFKAGRSPIPFRELVNGMRAIFAAKESLKTGQAVRVVRYDMDVTIDA